MVMADNPKIGRPRKHQTDAERSAAYRDRLAANGISPVNVVLDAEAMAALKSLKAVARASNRTIIGKALIFYAKYRLKGKK
jgi:hypothetical protein